MLPVHEEQTHEFIFGPTRVVEAIVQDDERARVDAALFVHGDFFHDLLHALLLPLQNVLDDAAAVLVVDENFGYVVAVKTVARLRAGDHRPDGDVLLVVEEVSDQERFTRVAPADQHDNGPFIFVRLKTDLAHVESF